jgi:hypothetical protein
MVAKGVAPLQCKNVTTTTDLKLKDVVSEACVKRAQRVEQGRFVENLASCKTPLLRARKLALHAGF